MLHKRISVITPYVEPYVHYFQWKLFLLVSEIHYFDLFHRVQRSIKIN